jgi:hypothetical protein
VRQTRLAARARSRPNHRTRMLLQQSNKIIIAAHPQGVGWSSPSHRSRAQLSAARSRNLNRRGWRSAISAIMAW